jgi:hypothetical protein
MVKNYCYISLFVDELLLFGFIMSPLTRAVSDSSPVKYWLFELASKIIYIGSSRLEVE